MKLQLSFAALLRIMFLVLLSATALFAQGPLNPPPGPPAPSMKSLTQIEPRIDLQSNPPAAGVNANDPNYEFVITAPGSYYLSANLSVTKPNGIQINAEGVTFHLQGFEISRTSGAGGNGIEIPPGAHRATISHGSIKGFARGIDSPETPAGFARASAFHHLSVSNCSQTGILTGEAAVLEACRVHDNGEGIRARAGSTVLNCTATKNSGTGISADSGSSVTDCTALQNGGNGIVTAGAGSVLKGCVASFNGGPAGISAGQAAIVSDCLAIGNFSSAATSAGIVTGNGSVVQNSNAKSNTSTSGVSTPATGMGISVGLNSIVRDCLASSNEGDGIHLQGSSLARDNLSSGNGFGGDGAGLHAIGSDNRIEGNNVTANDRGLDIDATGNLVIKNSASGNTANYEVVGSNFLGTIVVTEAAMNASTNSNINLAF